MLLDLFGYVKRNISKMDYFQKNKLLKEVKQIKWLLENDLYGDDRYAS